MTDRELLEMAAKAAGIVGEYSEEKKCFSSYMEPGWNPLTDDGDALRLAVKLEMLVEIEGHTARSVVKNGDHESYHTNGDPMAATRRAIVRAAAEIGKAMS